MTVSIVVRWLHRLTGTPLQRFPSPNVGSRMAWSAVVVLACIVLYGLTVILTYCSLPGPALSGSSLAPGFSWKDNDATRRS